MSAVRMMVAGLLVVVMVAGVRAEEKGDIDKEKLIGSWEVVKADEGAPPVGAVITFAKDGKMKVKHKIKDEEKTAEGTYTLKGNKLSVAIEHGAQVDKHTVTITKLTDTEMVAENEKGAKAEFKRKKK